MTCNGTPVDPDTPVNVEVGQEEVLSIVTSPAIPYTNVWNIFGGYAASVAGFNPKEAVDESVSAGADVHIRTERLYHRRLPKEHHNALLDRGRPSGG